MNKNTAIAVMAAAALLLGAAQASAGNSHGGSHGGGNNNTGGNSCRGNCSSGGGGGGGGSVSNQNTNVGVNRNYNHISNNNYNNVSNNNYNRNNNFNANANNNTNTNTNNNTNNNTNSNTNNNNSSASASANATSNANSSSGGGDGGSSTVNVSGDEAAASGAAPVYLTSSNDTCMGSSGIGGQGMSFGFSLGTTWTDSNCIMLKNARELKSQGHDKAAKARLCMDDDNAMAFELAGEPCPRALGSSQAAVAKIREWNPDYMTASATNTKPVQTQTAARRIVPSTDSPFNAPE